MSVKHRLCVCVPSYGASEAQTSDNPQDLASLKIWPTHQSGQQSFLVAPNISGRCGICMIWWKQIIDHAGHTWRRKILSHETWLPGSSNILHEEAPSCKDPLARIGFLKGRPEGPFTQCLAPDRGDGAVPRLPPSHTHTLPTVGLRWAAVGVKHKAHCPSARPRPQSCKLSLHP